MKTTERPKQIAAGVFAAPPKILRLPDGALMAFALERENPTRMIRARFSKDNGESWSELEPLFTIQQSPPELIAVTEAVLDRHGEIHAFLVRQWQPDSRGEGERGGPGTYNGFRIDIWHARSTCGRTSWQEPKCIWEGYTGSLNSSVLLKSGRILLPFSYYVPRTWQNRGEGLETFTFMGMFVATVLYSDDNGTTWMLSNSLTVVTPDITYAYGACEPVVMELSDGRVWMLIRTQMGRFYESFSPDGARWSRPVPSRIVSSDSPAGLARLNDGRIVLVWNNCLRYPYAYGGRQVIHAAISEDDGRTWRGCREVGRDPRRAEPPPPTGDHGTAYPFPAVTANNKVIISTGQGERRALLVRLDPDYLYETRQKADFAAGLEDWSVFGTRGVETVSHPEKQGRSVLRIRKMDDEFPACAVWNFPSGAQGRLRVRFFLEPGAQGLIVGLTDHFSTPFDFGDVFNNVFTMIVGVKGSRGDVCVESGSWHYLQLDWDGLRMKCRVKMDGQSVGAYPLQRQSSGTSYIRLQTVSDAPEAGGLLIETVAADVSRAWRQ